MRLIRLAVVTVLLVLSLGGGSSRSSASSSVQVFAQPGTGLSPVLSLIRGAKSSIRLEVYLLTSQTVVDELAKARRRGVDVRVLLEERPYGADRYATLGYNDLQRAGVSVRWANERAFTFTHEKAIEVDGRTAGIFTFNLTSSGIYRNREFGVIDRNSADAGALATIFAADWNRQHPRFSDSRLVVSPYNSRSDLERLIDDARHTLDVYAEEVADVTVERHLASAVHRGVRIRLITSQGSAGIDALRQSGVAVDIMPKPYVHAKAFIADGRRLFIGSENLSMTSLDDNREVGILLSDAGLASTVEKTFSSDWKGSSATSPPPSPPVSHSGSFQVRVSTSPGAVARGNLLTIVGHTSSRASCGVQVTYPDGYLSHAQALASSKTAGSDGVVSWSWHVGSTVTGTAHVRVTCTLDGQSASGTATFDIQG